uniref:Uncharacterized protein n=1 Tax=Acrobeloides nanus TaxID=290746 RepID=A0A914E600_9BILA
MKLKGLNNIVYPLRLPSSAAAHIFHCYKIQADVAYIDADHDYNAVVRNIQLYYPLVRKEGILMGHNFTLKGVEQALPFLNSSRMLSSITEHVNCANEDPYLIYYYSL